MKKNVLFVAMLFIALLVQAQERYDLPALFETGINEDVSGWTFYLDPGCNYSNSNYNWGVRQAQERNYNVLTTRAVEDLNLGNLRNVTKIDWAVLPVQDLSYYQNVQLKFTYIKGANAVEDPMMVKIYSMNIPDDDLSKLYTSTPVKTLTIGEDGGYAINPPVASEELVDIPNANIGTHTYMAIVYYTEGLNEYEFYNLDLTKVYLNVALKETGISETSVTLPVRIKNGNVIVSAQAGSMVEVYNVMGMRLRSQTATGEETEIGNLPKGQVLIVQNGNAVAKVVL